MRNLRHRKLNRPNQTPAVCVQIRLLLVTSQDILGHKRSKNEEGNILHTVICVQVVGEKRIYSLYMFKISLKEDTYTPPNKLDVCQGEEEEGRTLWQRDKIEETSLNNCFLHFES